MQDNSAINKKLQIPKEHFRIASRFMKEVGLYYYWMQYLNNAKTYKNWYNRNHRFSPIYHVFGGTQISRFLKERGVKLPYSGMLLYELFSRYVVEMHPEYTNRDVLDNACSQKFLEIDKEKKKIKMVLPNIT